MTVGLDLTNEEFEGVIKELDPPRKKQLIKLYRKHLRILSKSRKGGMGRGNTPKGRKVYK